MKCSLLALFLVVVVGFKSASGVQKMHKRTITMGSPDAVKSFPDAEAHSAHMQQFAPKDPRQPNYKGSKKRKPAQTSKSEPPPLTGPWTTLVGADQKSEPKQDEPIQDEKLRRRAEELLAGAPGQR
jgi:hypothetical protein